MAEKWHLAGKVLVACNCDWGCPCNFNARPTTGKCEGGWTWQVERGHYGDVRLDGLCLSVYANWPGAIHEGNGEALHSSRRARRRGAACGHRDAARRKDRRAMGNARLDMAEGARAVRRCVRPCVRWGRTRAKCGDYVEVECEPIRNPVSGAESHPGITLPEGHHPEAGRARRNDALPRVARRCLRSFGKVHGRRPLRLFLAVVTRLNLQRRFTVAAKSRLPRESHR